MIYALAGLEWTAREGQPEVFKKREADKARGSYEDALKTWQNERSSPARAPRCRSGRRDRRLRA